MRAAGSDSVLYDVGQAYADEAAQREKTAPQSKYIESLRSSVFFSTRTLPLVSGYARKADYHYYLLTKEPVPYSFVQQVEQKTGLLFYSRNGNQIQSESSCAGRFRPLFL